MRLLRGEVPEARDAHARDGNQNASKEYNAGSNATRDNSRGSDYTLARLKRDHPELAKQVVNGDMSANAAASSGKTSPTTSRDWEAMREQADKPSEVRQVSESGNGGRGKTEFSSETAEATGQSQPSINRATRLAREVCQQAEHLQRREDIFEAMKISSGASCTTAGGGAPGENKAFAQETAEATGVNKSTVTRATRRAREVCQQARAVRRAQELLKQFPVGKGAGFHESKCDGTDTLTTRRQAAKEAGMSDRQ